MSIIGYPELLLLALCCVFLCLWRWSWPKSSLPTTWPLVGMFPRILRNVHRIHDYATELLQETGGTFVVKGPWFANVDMVVTSDPANVHHILSKNFSNYPKGPEFNKIFDLLGDGIFNADSKLWETQRKTTMSLMNHANFQYFLERTTWSKVENGLIPILDRAMELGLEVDLVELFQKFTYDSSCKLILGYDPGSLSIDLTHIPPEKAFDVAEEAILYRHILPECYWKLQRWLQIGQEKKLHKAWETVDNLVTHCISLKRQEQSKRRSSIAQDQEEDFDLLTSLMEAYKGISGTSGNSDKFLRDSSLSLVFAARDTTSVTLSWFFSLLAKNPSVQSKIREEIKTNSDSKEYKKWRLFNNLEELNKLVYLHGALCESLRLFPAVPFQHKAPLQPDTLPSGHQIDQNTKTVLSFYSMGRMETIWGKDCLEFKPERWISDNGGIKHVPSFKFTAFNAGPRSCLGKEMAFIQMKIVAAAIIYHYHIEVVDGHPIAPSNSIVLHMKHGLKVRVTNSCV